MADCHILLPFCLVNNIRTTTREKRVKVEDTVYTSFMNPESKGVWLLEFSLLSHFPETEVVLEQKDTEVHVGDGLCTLIGSDRNDRIWGWVQSISKL